MSLILRNAKGSQLTFNEMDGNFTYLEGLDQQKLTTSSFNNTTGSFVSTSSFNALTSSFATTGSNQFKAAQTISGSLTVSGSINQKGIGEANTFVGDGAGFSNIPGGGSGDYNTFIGVVAGGANVYGRGNTAIGPYALDNNLNGINNIAIGTEAGRYAENFDGNFISNESIYIGNGAQAKSNNQINQIVIGNFITGNGNNTVTIGDNNITATYLKGAVTITGSIQLTGSSRVIGNQTLTSGSLIVTGSSLFISPSYGNGLGNEKSGSRFTQNTTTLSMVVKPSGSSNGGVISVYDNNDGNSTVNLYGSTLLIGNTSANFILFGNASTTSNFFGTYNFRTGINVTGSLLVTGSANIIGGITGSSFTGSFVGDGSGLTGIPGVTPIATGSFATTGSNLFIGNQVISGSITLSGSVSQIGIGTNNTIFGVDAGLSRTTGAGNTLIGKGAGERATTANSITIIGANAGSSITTGGSNTFIGTSAGQSTGTGTGNTAVGTGALFANTTGTSNTAIGTSALSYLGPGNSGNIALGNVAGAITINGDQIVNADRSIFIGDSVRSKQDNQTNEIVIGNDASGEGSNTTVIGNYNTTNTYLKGTLNITTAILSEVSASLNFNNDTQAAAGGVPLGGLYRHGSVIHIRIV